MVEENRASSLAQTSDWLFQQRRSVTMALLLSYAFDKGNAILKVNVQSSYSSYAFHFETETEAFQLSNPSVVFLSSGHHFHWVPEVKNNLKRCRSAFSLFFFFLWVEVLAATPDCRRAPLEVVPMEPRPFSQSNKPNCANGLILGSPSSNPGKHTQINQSLYD